MYSAAELVRKTSERLHREAGIDAGLEEVATAAEGSADPAGAARKAGRLLRDRIQSVADALDDLQSLSDTLKYLRRILPYTPEGWPHERERLRAAAGTNPPGSVAEWLQYWYGAACSYRLDALEWLAQDVPLPKGAELLGERGMVAITGLKEGNWHLASPMLLAGAAGMRLGDTDVPGSEAVQASLRLLLARLALQAGKLDEAEDLLGAVGDRGASAAVLALRARRLRLAHNDTHAFAALAKAQEADPGDLDVVTERILQAGDDEHPDVAMEIALVGADALTSLLDIDSALGRLLQPPAELWVAVADRAAREGNPELARRALGEADTLVAQEDQQLLAMIAERRGELTDHGAARLRDLLASGDLWLDSGKIDQARIEYEKALAEEGGEGVTPGLLAQAAIRRADCVAALSFSQPLRLVAGEVADALRQLVAAQATDDIATAESWNYLVEARLRDNLARAADAGRADQLWRGFLAAARATALSPAEGQRWNILSLAAQGLYFYVTAEAAARQAKKLGEEDVSQLISALI